MRYAFGPNLQLHFRSVEFYVSKGISYMSLDPRRQPLQQHFRPVEIYVSAGM